MLELDILGLVDKADDVRMVCSDGVTRNGSQITLKEEFQWFLSEEFTSLRQGFKPTKGEEQEAREEKSPRHTDPILDRIEESNTDISIEQSTSQYENDPLRGGKISSPASYKEQEESYYLCYYCHDCNTSIKEDYERHVVLKHPGKPAYPNKAEIEKRGLKPQGKPWET